MSRIYKKIKKKYKKIYKIYNNKKADEYDYW